MNIKCMLDNKQYTVKPEGKEIGVITNRLVKSSIEIDIKDLAESLTRGQTFKPSFLNGKKETNWISQQLFALDFDENTTIEEELNRCKELNILPAFGYTSFSHTEEHNKFRLVFCTDEAITDYNVAKQLQLSLMSIFNNCDEKCKNLSRLYFGGKELIYKNYDNRINYNEIIEKYPIETSNINAQEITPHNNNYIYNTINLVGGKTPANKVYYDKSIYIKTIQKLDSKTLRNLIISRVTSEGVYGELIDEEYISYSISVPKTPMSKTIDTTMFSDILVVKNKQNLYKLIDSIDLYYFLGLDNNLGDELFNCILPDHEDNSPSAHIYITDDGTQIYKCFGCEFVGGILKLVQKIAHCNISQSINFIKEVYNIKLEYSEWQKEKIEIIEDNIDYLFSNKMQYEYPELYKRIKDKILKLNVLLDVAKRNIYDEDISYNDNPVFFTSLNNLMSLFNTNNKKSLSKDINLFALLNLIEKLPEEKIPKDMLNKSKHISALKGYKKIPNYYIIPSYDVSVLEKSEHEAEILKKNNFTMKGLSREWVYRTFGEEKANEIFPQYIYENSKGNSKASDKRTSDITKIILKLIDKKSYATEKEVIKLLRNKYGKNNTEVQLKKSLQEILLSYNLKRIRCNKEIKEQYGVADNGYPFIIVKNN